jgi:anti-sigma regulatory factor (Ser/Thr protein kinase)
MLPAQRIALPRHKTVALVARRHMEAVCAAVQIAADSVLLAVSEVATNAYLHTDGPIDLHWWIENRQLMVEISDDEFVLLRLPDNSSEDAEEGRGLHIVVLVCSNVSWGSTGDGGKWVRVAFDLAPAGDESVNDARALATRPRPSPERPRRFVQALSERPPETPPTLVPQRGGSQPGVELSVRAFHRRGDE